MLLSCLSAHAALAVFDGIERTRLTAKCTGVFPQQADPAHPLAAGLGCADRPAPLPSQHGGRVGGPAARATRWRCSLTAVGWSVITKTVGDTEVVLVQGHPEYDPSSLLREYHRDARRYVLDERDDVPCLPLDCVAPEDWDRLQRLQERIGRR